MSYLTFWSTDKESDELGRQWAGWIDEILVLKDLSNQLSRFKSLHDPQTDSLPSQKHLFLSCPFFVFTGRQTLNKFQLEVCAVVALSKMSDLDTGSSLGASQHLH